MVTIEPPKPQLDKLQGEEWEVYRVMSESEPGLYHVVAVHYDAGEVPIDWICSCKGFNYRKTCWHVRELGQEDAT